MSKEKLQKTPGSSTAVQSGDLPRGRPKEEGLRQRRQDEILVEATKHFAEKGYAGTDIDSIAQCLGVGKGTIYRYFPSKRDLLESALHKGLSDLDRFVEGQVGQVEDYLEKIYVAVRAFFAYFDDHPELTELFLQERACFRDQPQPSFFNFSQANIEPWLERYYQLIEAGRVRASVPLQWLSLVNEMLFGLILTNHMLNRRGHHAEQAEHFLRIVFEGLWTEKEHAEHTLYSSIPAANLKSSMAENQFAIKLNNTNAKLKTHE